MEQKQSILQKYKLLFYILINYYMFSSVLNSILDKLSGLNPIKSFLKYAIDKTLNQILNDQLTLEDFKNGCLNVANIGFNVEKINKVHLIASPYILHKGSIGNLKIILPPLSQITKKSIQIEVHDVSIQLKPNKNFYQNFKIAIQQIQQNDMFFVEEKTSQQQISENSPIDFFKQLLKQILLNIKIKINNVVIKLYMNSPEKIKSKDQYYLMLRIPQIGVNKNVQNYQKSVDKDEIRFNIQVPQFSLHLLNQSTSYPQFINQKCSKQDFPFKYPNVNHPSTILLFGLTDLINLDQQTKKKIPKISFIMITDYKLKKKQFLIKTFVSNIQVMVDPIQLQIFSRFMVQIKEFKNILQYVKNQLNLKGQKLRMSNQPNFQRHKSNGRQSQDFFSSMIYNSIAGDYNNDFFNNKFSSGIRASNKMGSGIRGSQKFIDEMIKQNKDLNKSVIQFNNQCKRQIEKQNKSKQIQQQFTQQFRSLNFSTNFQFQIEMTELYLYLLKCVPTQNYRRQWIKNFNNKINQSIPISYFMLVIRKLNYCLSQNGKNSQLSVTKLKIQNVKISKSNFNKQNDQFLDLQSSTQFYKQNSQPFQSVRQNLFQKQLRNFELKNDQHFCIQQIVRISQKPGENYVTDKIRKYNFLPKQSNHQEIEYVLYKPGFKLHFNNKQQFLKVDIEQVAVSLNSLIIKQIVQIMYPVFSYKTFVNNVDSCTQIQRFQTKNSAKYKKSLLESQYTFSVDDSALQTFIQTNKKELTIILNIHQINIGFYQVQQTNDFQDLIKKFCQKKQDSDTLSQKCFCNLHRKQFYFECLSVQIQKKGQNTKLSLKNIVSGIIQLNNSLIKNVKALIKIQSNSQEMIKLFIDKDHPSKTQTLSIYVPDIQILLTEQSVLQILNIVKKQLIVVQNILNYTRYLKIKMQSINKQGGKIQGKQNKKFESSNQKNIEIYIKNVNLSFFQLEVFVKGIFIKKKPNQLKFKFDSFLLGLQQEYQLFLAEIKNEELCLTQYFDKGNARKHKLLADENIILQIHNQQIKNEKFYSKNKNKFFDGKQNQKGSIQIKIYKEQIKMNEKGKFKIKVANNQKFKMIKFRQNLSTQAPIQQQQTLPKIIQVNFNRSVHVCAINLVRLSQKKQKIVNFLDKIKQLTNQIAIQSKSLAVVDRKLSNASDSETNDLEIRIGNGNITIDVRPQFKKKNKQIILSNTRSFIKLEWTKAAIISNNDFKNIDIQATVRLQVNFLTHFDRSIIINPILLSQKELQPLGFIQILQIDQFKFNLKVVQKKVTCQISVGLIRCEMSTSTLGYLKMHIQHFLMHNLKQQYGVTIKQEQDEFCLLQMDDDQENILQDQDDLQIQDLTGAYYKYTEKLQNKKHSQQQFLKIGFVDPSVQNCDFHMKKIQINKVRIRIYNGSDFQFINVQSLNESKENKRNKLGSSQQMKYIQMRVQNIYSCLKIKKNLEDSQIQTFIKLQTFEINMSYSKPSEGFFKRLINNNKLSEQIMFPIIKNDNQIKIIIKQNQKKSYFKFYNMNLDIGFRSDLLSFIEQIKSQNIKIQKSGWKKVYPQQNQNKLVKNNNEKLLLIMVPETKLNLRLIYNGIQVLSNQQIKVQQFLLHQQIKNQGKMQKVITMWLKNLIINNVGGVISGSAIKLFSKIIEQIFFVFKFLLGNLFGKGSQDQLK